MEIDLKLQEKITKLEELVKVRTTALTKAQTQLKQAVVERKQAEAEQGRLLATERAQAQRQAALVRLSAELAATLDESEVCWRVVNGLRETLGYAVVVLFLLDEVTGERVIAAQVGYEELPERIRPGEGLSEHPLLDGQLHYTPDFRNEPHYYLGVWGSEVDLPIRISGKVLGVLSVENKDINAFNQGDFEVLTAAAHQTGLAIEKARLFSEVERRVTEMATLTEIGKALSSTLRVDEVLKLIYDQTRRVMYAEDMLIVFYDEEHHEMECVFSTNPKDICVGQRGSDDVGFASYVIKHGKSLLLHGDLDKRAHEMGVKPVGGVSAEAWLGVPLLRGKRVHGLIVLQHYTDPKAFDESQQALLETIAS